MFNVDPTLNDVPFGAASHRLLLPGVETPILTEEIASILEWPTDTTSIDYYRHTADGISKRRCPHTVLLFVPGNPGCVGWYKDLLFAIVSRFGMGYAARGVSYAGHGLALSNVEKWQDAKDRKRDVNIPWTVNGQISHKMEWVDQVVEEMKKLRQTQTANETRAPPTRYVFISHSIGAHMVQRLCVLRKDILLQTKLLIHLMPFTRMDAPQPQQAILTTLACSQDAVISVATAASRLASIVPRKWVDFIMRDSVPHDEGRQLAVGLIRQPTFPRNFFELGTEEIRDVPERPDDSALRLIGKLCPTAMLYCGGPDQWAPKSHMDDLELLRRRGRIPNNIRMVYMPDLVHDFVVRPHMVQPVIEFCCQSISNVNFDDKHNLRSSL